MTSTPPPRYTSGPARAASAAARRPVVIPRRMPMRQARRVSLFEREVRVRLSPAAIEILFSHAAVLSEGQIDGDSYYGSTMVTIDLGRVGVHVSEACDVATARNVESLLGTDPRVHARALGLGVREAARLSRRELRSPQVDISVRRNGHHFHLDVDVEAWLEERA